MDDAERERLRTAYGRRSSADVYSTLRQDVILAAAERNVVWAGLLQERGGALGQVVEIGTGSGITARWALEAGATRAIGIDALWERLGAARRYGDIIHLIEADGRNVPLRDGSADTVICSTIFSSILDDRIATKVGREVSRILRSDGRILWFDLFRENPSNPDVRRVRRPDIRKLFPDYDIDLRRVVLAPPLARRLRFHHRLATALALLPFLRTHYAGVLERRMSSTRT